MILRGSSYDGRVMLVHSGTLQPVMVGEVVESFRGDRATVMHGTGPHKAGAAGYVYVSQSDGTPCRGYYPSVFGLEWKRTEAPQVAV